MTFLTQLPPGNEDFQRKSNAIVLVNLIAPNNNLSSLKSMLKSLKHGSSMCNKYKDLLLFLKQKHYYLSNNICKIYMFYWKRINQICSRHIYQTSFRLW